MKIVDPLCRMIVKANYDVAFAHSALSRWAVLFESYDQDAILNRQVVKPHDAAVQGNVLSCETDVAATHSAIAYQTAGDEFCRVDGRRKTDPLCRQNHRG